MISSKNRFHIILFTELIFLPVLYLFHWAKVLFGSSIQYIVRKDVASNVVEVCVHEWGGYPMERTKTIKNGATFNCGLEWQLQRFENRDNVRLTVTMSDVDMHQEVEQIKGRTANFIEVSNVGMDFSGYAAFYNKIKEQPNSYVIISNSSVNSTQTEFLSDYIAYMEVNKDVGMLGVSYCTKVIQTLIRKNFTPHLQSFFLVTTTDVLDQVVKLNKDIFPGFGVDHKLLLIRKGEIKLSKLVERLGYRLAVVNPVDGNVYKIEKYKFWKLAFGDVRQIINNPNIITPINQ